MYCRRTPERSLSKPRKPRGRRQAVPTGHAEVEPRALAQAPCPGRWQKYSQGGPQHPTGATHRYVPVALQAAAALQACAGASVVCPFNSEAEPRLPGPDPSLASGELQAAAASARCSPMFQPRKVPAGAARSRSLLSSSTASWARRGGRIFGCSTGGRRGCFRAGYEPGEFRVRRRSRNAGSHEQNPAGQTHFRLDHRLF